MGVSFPVRAITLDLDDTLWPFAPVGARVEHAQHAWLLQHCPRTAARFPIDAMRALREQINSERPDLAHDFSSMRRLTLARAMQLSGDDPVHADAAFEAFFAERNRVECYPDAKAALQRLAACVPLAALSNGNADLRRIGLDMHFEFQLGASEHGKPKPSPCIFHAACARFALAPHEVLHVGDDVEMDVLGALRAGLRSCWINRPDASGAVQAWPHDEPRPDLEFASLAGLADWLEHSLSASPSQTAAA
jgi:FMN hydrolase / 5-amino-6-(5-phospho-D-ribitylamino)uracil phosphatase